MDDPRKAHIEEMNRLADAIYRTESPYLKRDYAKALNRMERELREYDMYMLKRARANNGGLRIESESK